MAYCIQEASRALKSSFLSEIAMKSSQPTFIDDVWCVTEINNVNSDDFSVDDLLDFSDKDFKDSHDQDHEEKHSFSLPPNSTTAFFGSDDFDSLDAGQLPVPADDLENLEWLSQFVDDSRSELSLLCPTPGCFKQKIEASDEKPAVERLSEPCFPTPVPVKKRSKRSRGNGRAWSLGSPSLSTTESSSTTSSSSYGSSALSPFVFGNPVQDSDLFSSVEKPAAKKIKRSTVDDSTTIGGGPQAFARRCSHCQVQKTPQWRTGPLGPKTLCNACGVRYKSGRLFPEYRPACSPTFSQDVHSNSHRKVLEMRRKKETTGLLEPGLTPVVPSY